MANYLVSQDDESISLDDLLYFHDKFLSSLKVESTQPLREMLLFMKYLEIQEEQRIDSCLNLFEDMSQRVVKGFLGISNLLQESIKEVSWIREEFEATLPPMMHDIEELSIGEFVPTRSSLSECIDDGDENLFAPFCLEVLKSIQIEEKSECANQKYFKVNEGSYVEISCALYDVSEVVCETLVPTPFPHSPFRKRKLNIYPSFPISFPVLSKLPPLEDSFSSIDPNDSPYSKEHEEGSISFTFPFVFSYSWHPTPHRHRVAYYFVLASHLTLAYLLHFDMFAIVYDKLLRSLSGYLLEVRSVKLMT
ncbi:uncharacterized protein [Spinacia oleracea]|uniref:Gamma-tubulin complex component n=1 Tax=Spinacia oleracea TaxID=3562 RepID=A0ABM3QJD0_SPIOL|nr:uncharacterized protein LOC130459862 [Spinacia oleracea]